MISYASVFWAALGFAVLALVVSLPLHDVPREGHEEEPSHGFAAALRQTDLLPLWWIGGIFAIALASVFAFRISRRASAAALMWPASVAAKVCSILAMALAAMSA